MLNVARVRQCFSSFLTPPLLSFFRPFFVGNTIMFKNPGLGLSLRSIFSLCAVALVFFYAPQTESQAAENNSAVTRQVQAGPSKADDKTPRKRKARDILKTELRRRLARLPQRLWAAPQLLKPSRLIKAASAGKRNKRGLGLPGCGSFVTVPASMKPKPSAAK